MDEYFVGRVAELWRYPVKSMLGERRSQLPITTRGALGDRAWALRETATGRIASAKRFPQLLAFHARYEVEPTFETPGRIQISLPDGRTICPDDPDASAIISDSLGHSVRLENQPASDEKTGIDRATVFGDVPVSTMKA
ncbi:MAG: MOSC N-terminal beta barrel domain-containing protein, partial [Bryobacteraceae bacterium]